MKKSAKRRQSSSPRSQSSWLAPEEEWHGAVVETISFGARMARFFLSAPCVIFHSLVLFESMRRLGVDPNQLDIHHMVNPLIGYNGKCWVISPGVIFSTAVSLFLLVLIAGPVVFAATKMGGFERMVSWKRQAFLALCLLFCLVDFFVYGDYIRLEGTIISPWYVEVWIWVGWIVQVVVKSMVWYKANQLPETVGGRSLLIIFGGFALIFGIEFFHYGPPCTQDVLDHQTHPVEVRQQSNIMFGKEARK